MLDKISLKKKMVRGSAAAEMLQLLICLSHLLISASHAVMKGTELLINYEVASGNFNIGGGREHIISTWLWGPLFEPKVAQKLQSLAGNSNICEMHDQK